MNGKFKSIVLIIVSSLLFGLAYPGINALADEDQNGQITLWDIEEENEVQYDNKGTSATVDVSKNKLIINGIPYNKAKLINLLNTAYETSPTSSGNRQARFAAAAGVYLIPGVGEVALAATGAIILGGVTIGAGHWAYKTITSYFKEHTKNKRKSTHNKHTKPRPGRQTEKKKQNPKWKKRG